jgi:hypothetical protein
MPRRNGKRDPRLLAAMSEIKAIADKYDVAIHVNIVSKTHAEFAVGFPTWSIAQYCANEDGDQIRLHFNTDIPSIKTIKQKKKAIAEALHIIHCIGENAARQANTMAEVLKAIEEAITDNGDDVPKLNHTRVEEYDHRLIMNPAQYGYAER